MKKITLLVIILIIFNFICSSINVVYATEPAEPSGTTTTDPDPNDPDNPDKSDDTGSEDGVMMSQDRYKKLDEGKADINGNETKIQLGDSDVGSFGSKCASFISTLAGVCAKVVSNVAREGGLVFGDGEYSVEKKGVFTINSLVFGEYFMFNSAPYEKSTDVVSGGSSSAIVKLMDNIKEIGAGIGKLIIRVGIFISLPLFLIALIKTVTAKKAADVAAWKKILVRWVLCLALLFLFQYILITIDSASRLCTDTLWKMRLGLEENDFKSFEVEIEEDIIKALDDTGGVTSLGYAIEFLVMVVIQMIFFAKYLVRAFALIFLFIIAPFIIVKHSISLMLGNESDSLGTFFKYYIMLSFMMPFHALVYYIFILSMSEIAINAPVLGMILLYAVLRAGSIAKAMLGLEIGSSILGAKEEG